MADRARAHGLARLGVWRVGADLFIYHPIGVPGAVKACPAAVDRLGQGQLLFQGEWV
ncbi:MAG: hypothetical protein BWX73_03080 [Lentisphaerae bacterium ADurb.Bin082]|nr:MAG: hypothetical protein BWX73_03080 [Lentisphaerae bacterium ADurb.Bin082]